MGHLSQSFTHLETKAEAISTAQTLQAETQARLHNQMEVAMQVAQGYLSEISSTALDLQAIISETASKIQSMTAFARVFGFVFNWVLTASVGLVAFSALAVLVTVWRYSHKVVVTIISAIGRFSPIPTWAKLTMYSSAATLLFTFTGAYAYTEAGFARIYRTSLLILDDPFSLASAVFAVFSFLGIICYSIKARRRLHKCYSV